MQRIYRQKYSKPSKIRFFGHFFTKRVNVRFPTFDSEFAALFNLKFTIKTFRTKRFKSQVQNLWQKIYFPIKWRLTDDGLKVGWKPLYDGMSLLSHCDPFLLNLSFQTFTYILLFCCLWADWNKKKATAEFGPKLSKWRIENWLLWMTIFHVFHVLSLI